MLISQNENFQREISEFSQRIEQLDDAQHRAQMTDILNKLASSVRTIDQYHLDLNLGKNNIEVLKNLRENVKSFRKQLYRGLGISS